MALALKDRVKETTIVVGTGTATLLGSSIGFQPFSVVGNGNTTYYCISDQFGSNWEVGIGTYSTSGNTLARTTVLASSNGGALVVFTAGIKDVFVTYPAEKGVWLDASNNAIGLGTPAAFVGTNITGTASGLTAGNVTTNANLTGAVTSTGNATSLGSFTSAQLALAISDETGTGKAVFATNPTLTSPTYAGTLTGSTDVLNIGSGQVYKDASGNVGIGCTPNVNSGQKLQLGAYQGIGASGISQNLGYYAVGGVYNWRYPLGNTGWLSGSISTGVGGSYYLQVHGAPACTGAVDSVASENLLYYIDSSFNHVWRRSGNAESMRIDSSGNLLVGTTISGYPSTNAISLRAQYGDVIAAHPNGTSSGSTYMQFAYNGGGIGSITQNGTTGVLYNLTSDYRLKNNPTALTGASEFIKALQPKTWDWWDGSGKGVGFIAHEFMEVAKYSGNGTKDEVDAEGKPVMQSIQPSSPEVMANLVSFVQELKAIIDTQQEQINSLLGK